MFAVPAWRRLGLKLKSERQDAAGASQAPTSSHSPVTNTNEFHGANTAYQRHSAEDSSLKSAKLVHSTNGSSDTLRSSLKSATPSASSKTVSFQSSSNSSSPCVEQAEIKAAPAPSPQEFDNPAEISRRHEAKREKRKQRQQGSQDAQSSIKPYIAYLQSYSEERGEWKFNKNLQNQIFKYLFDVHRIPPELDGALVDYVNGLQGKSAQQRIENGAKAILAELENDPEAYPAEPDANAAMESPEYQKQALQNARAQDAMKVKSILKKRVESAAERQYARDFPAKLRRRERAMKLLDIIRRKYELDDSKAPNTTPLKIRFDSAENGSAQQNANGAGGQKSGQQQQQQQKAGRKRSRGRKRRGLLTGVPDDDNLTDSSSAMSSSSSDDSSSSSEDDSSSSEDEPNEQSKQPTPKRQRRKS